MNICYSQPYIGDSVASVVPLANANQPETRDALALERLSPATPSLMLRPSFKRASNS